MIAKVNKLRRDQGLAPLRTSGTLTHSSRRYARWILRNDYFGHLRRIRASSRFRPLGEALAYHRGYRSRISGTVRKWRRSPSHRAVILSSRYRYIGAAKWRGRLGRRKATVWVLQVGS